MNARIKALAWEECRVGGMISVCCLIAGLLFLLNTRWLEGETAWQREPEILLIGVLGIPFFTSLLLILNLSYSEHLAGGFSMRVLRLPVATSIAVGVALVARAFFVFCVALISFVVTRQLFGGGPHYESVFLIVLVYLVTQFLDWLRIPISGLSSLLALSVIAFVVYGVGHAAVLQGIMSAQWLTFGMWIVLLAIVATPIYGLSVVAVHSARVGRSVGIPEVWEWPGRISINANARLKPFASPITAEIWYELRRTAWKLPVVTFGLWLLVSGTMWLYWDKQDMETWRAVVSVLPFFTFLMASLFYGVLNSVVGIRRAVGVIGVRYLQPMTSAEFALARTLANLAVFIPTVLAILVIHFLIYDRTFVDDVLPFAFRSGAASLREVFWILLSRGFLVGLLAWPILGWGSKSFGRMYVLAIATIAFPLLVAWGMGWDKFWGTGCLFSGYLTAGLLITALIGNYLNAWRSGLLSLRTIIVWACVWLLVAWLLQRSVPLFLTAHEPSVSRIGSALIVCLGYASLIPLPFVSLTRDISRKRCGVFHREDSRQHHYYKQRHRTANLRIFGAIASAAVALIVIWLAWPTKPAYFAYLHAKGLPANIDDLNAWYPPVPERDNVALKYLALGSKVEHENEKFYERMYETKPPESFANPYTYFRDHLLIVGEAKLPESGPIPEDTWKVTKAYWDQVTSHVATSLKQLAANGPHASRYPLNLKSLIDVFPLDESKSWLLADQLHLDAIYWGELNEPGKVVESLNALFPLANSLADRPTQESILVRSVILRSASSALHDIQNRVEFTDEELLLLQNAFTIVFPSARERNRAIVGDSTIDLVRIGEFELLKNSELGSKDFGVTDPFTTLLRLVLPPDADRVALLWARDKVKHKEIDSVASNSSVSKDSDRINLESLILFAPIASFIVDSKFPYSSERSQTNLNLAQASLAMRRYQLANGHWPQRLEDLVPAYLPKIPRDFDSSKGENLRYVLRDDGSCVIYSVGPNQIDESGRSDYENDKSDYIAFPLYPQPHKLAPS